MSGFMEDFYAEVKDRIPKEDRWIWEWRVVDWEKYIGKAPNEGCIVEDLIEAGVKELKKEWNKFEKDVKRHVDPKTGTVRPEYDSPYLNKYYLKNWEIYTTVKKKYLGSRKEKSENAIERQSDSR